MDAVGRRRSGRWAEGPVSSPLGAASQKCDVTLLRVVVQWLAFVDDVNSEQL